jgi:spermidine/putrescine transport system substrate-binding protein
MTWNETPLSLKDAGVEAKFANPKEGALTWCCGVSLMKNAPHPERALELIDAMIDPRSGQALITDFGYGHSNQKAFDLVSAEDLEARGLSKQPMEVLSRGKFAASQPPEVDQAITEQYEKLKAGF